MTKTDSIIFNALVERGSLDKDSLTSLAKEAEKASRPLSSVLIEHNIISEQDALGILSQSLKIPCIDPKGMPIDKSVLDKVPLKIATYYNFMPVKLNERTLTIAVAYPPDIKTQDEIRTQLGYDIDIALSRSADIADSLKKHYGLAAETLEKISSSQNGPDAFEAQAQEIPQDRIEDIEKLAGDASVIRLVNQVILDAFRKRATDIHIEPYRGKVSVRYRIDGLLYDANVPPQIRNFLNAIISRIKIMSNLNIVERRLPQDGRAVVRIQEQVLDLRVSTIPTPFGESVVIRILPTQMLFSLEKLGLARRDLEIFEELIKKPHGIIFVTGPTGSGKTTTLYACLSRINTKERKIITIEDPIEYEMSGITQIQVMPDINLDFARGLRSMLRHDPDVMMVGEVRDLETAEIAIRVALTGHLVFSTLHTNDAASGITRLVDIGVEPYLVASSVEAFIAQRLVRVICQDCKQQDNAAPFELRELIAKEANLKSINEAKIYKGSGCQSCNFTGFFGRTAIYEILLIDEALKDLILKKVPAGQIKKLAVENGMRTLRQDGWQKVILGLTTPEEVMRVTSAEYDMEAKPKEEVRAAAQSLDADKRVYSRLNSKVNLRFRVFKSKKELLERGLIPEQLTVTKNISAGGILFFSEEPLAAGSILELKIELPDNEEPIQCLARIIRAEETEKENIYNLAACFLDITGAERARLDRFVEVSLK